MTAQKVVKTVIFDEIYGQIYKIIGKTLKTAKKIEYDDEFDDTGLYQVDMDEKDRLIKKYGYYNEPKRNTTEDEAYEAGQSVPEIQDKLISKKPVDWIAIDKKGVTPIGSAPENIITLPVARWLESVKRDERIRLFMDQNEIESIGTTSGEDNKVMPLYSKEDIIYFDAFGKSDNFNDPEYIKRFRMILDAVKSERPLHIEFVTDNDRFRFANIIPHHLEYSEKENRFRVVGIDIRKKFTSIINLGRITKCAEYIGEEPDIEDSECSPEKVYVVFELDDSNNALERVMLHFAHFEKSVIKDDEKENFKYMVKVFYDKADRMEMIIRLMSFGETIKVMKDNVFPVMDTNDERKMDEEIYDQVVGRVREQMELLK